MPSDGVNHIRTEEASETLLPTKTIEEGFDRPIFSIITPVRDARGFISGCLESVAEQQQSTHLEHLLADGGSTDGTLDILESRSARIISTQDNGMYDAIQRGFSQAQGIYLAWLNADEQYQPGALDAVRRAFEQTDADVVLGSTMTVRPDGRPVRLLDPRPLRFRYVRAHTLHSLSAATFLHRRLLDNGLLRFDPSYRASADLELMLRLLASGVRITYVNDLIAAFAVHDGNLGQTQLALDETERIRRQYGDPARLTRLMMRAARQVEIAIDRSRSTGPTVVSWRQAGSELRTHTTYVGRRGHCVQ